MYSIGVVILWSRKFDWKMKKISFRLLLRSNRRSSDVQQSVEHHFPTGPRWIQKCFKNIEFSKGASPPLKIIIFKTFCTTWFLTQKTPCLWVLSYFFKLKSYLESLFDNLISILFGLYIAYFEPSMIPPASHVIPKNEILGLKNGVFSKYGWNTSTGCDWSHGTLIKTKMASISFV